MTALGTTPIVFYNDEKGRSLSEARLFFYENESATFKDTFTDPTLSSPNPNPLIADKAGRFPAFFLDGIYRVTLKDENGVTIFEQDNVNYADATLNALIVQIQQDITTLEAGLSSAQQEYSGVYIDSNTIEITPLFGDAADPFEGLVAEFNLPPGINTAPAQITLNGVTDNLLWINGSFTEAGDLDSDYNKRIRIRYDGSDWLILSDISGNNSNGSWSRYSNGIQICWDEQSVAVSSQTFAALTYTWGKVFLNSDYSINTLCEEQVGGSGWFGWYVLSRSDTVAEVRYLDYENTARTGTLVAKATATGRWY